MKNQSINAAFRKGILNLLIIGISLMVMSFKNADPKANTYQIVSSKIVIEGTGKINDWKMQVDNSKFEGNFISAENQLEDIQGFRFSFPIIQSQPSNQLGGEAIMTSLLDKNCGEITFNQKSLMILPIMKMIHLVGEIKIGKDTHNVPMQMQYVLNEDGSMMLYGKQFIKLSEFGITLPNVKSTDREEEITINITIKLAKQQAVFAKLKSL